MTDEKIVKFPEPKPDPWEGIPPEVRKVVEDAGATIDDVTIVEIPAEAFDPDGAVELTDGLRQLMRVAFDAGLMSGAGRADEDFDRFIQIGKDTGCLK